MMKFSKYTLFFLPLLFSFSVDAANGHKKSAIPPLVKHQQLPAYQNYVDVQRAMSCVEKELTKNGLQEHVAWKIDSNYIDHSTQQTEQGIFLDVFFHDTFIDSFRTPFGKIALALEYGPLEHRKMMATTQALLQQFKAKLHKQDRFSSIYQVEVVDSIEMPPARMRKPCVKEKIIRELWCEYEKQHTAEQEAAEKMRVEEVAKAAAREAEERKKFEDEGWDFVEKPIKKINFCSKK